MRFSKRGVGWLVGWLGLMGYFSSCMSGKIFPRTPWRYAEKRESETGVSILSVNLVVFTGGWSGEVSRSPSVERLVVATSSVADEIKLEASTLPLVEPGTVSVVKGTTSFKRREFLFLLLAALMGK